MSDLIELTAGARPWLPAPGTNESLRLDEYNIPLAGIVHQHGHDYLYVCAAGEENDVNVWLYVTLELPEVDRLRSALGPSVVEAMRLTLQNKCVTAALADKLELVMWQRFDAGIEEPGVLVQRFLRLLDVRLRRYHEDVTSLKHDRSIDADQELLTL